MAQFDSLGERIRTSKKDIQRRLIRKNVIVENNFIRINFEGGGHMIIGFIGKDNSGKPLHGIMINDGTNDRIFMGLQENGF